MVFCVTVHSDSLAVEFNGTAQHIASDCFHVWNNQEILSIKLSDIKNAYMRPDGELIIDI